MGCRMKRYASLFETIEERGERREGGKEEGELMDCTFQAVLIYYQNYRFDGNQEAGRPSSPLG